MTLDNITDEELMDTGKFKRAVLERLNLAIKEVEEIKRMKEEERQEREGIWNAVKRVIMAVVYEKGWAEKPGKPR